MKYLVISEGRGEGCDYTIGCNMNYKIEEFDGSLEDAKKHFVKEILEEILGNDGLYDVDMDNPDVVIKIDPYESHVADTIMVIPVSDDALEKIDIDAEIHAFNIIGRKNKEAKEDKEEEDKDRAEWERLKVKFGE